MPSDDYQDSPDFQKYLWFLAQWSNFQTPFLLACFLTDDIAEQDEMRPILQAMVEQYNADKAIGTILMPAAFCDWQQANNQLEQIQDRYADAWLKSHAA